MEDFNTLVETYTISKEEKGTKEQTHTFFGKGFPITLSVPSAHLDQFYETYFAYISSLDADSLKSGMNCLTEKCKKSVNKLYVDLDLKTDNFSDGIVRIEDVPTIMERIISTFHTVVSESLGYEVEMPITAFRMIYKCHMYFTDVLFTPNQCEIICNDVEQRLAKEYPWLKKTGMIDKSVYTTGLRMLGSHKGSMGAKRGKKDKNREEEANHKQLFPSIPYVHYYRVGHLQQNGSIDYEDLSLETIKATSIIVPHNTEPLRFDKAYAPKSTKRQIGRAKLVKDIGSSSTSSSTSEEKVDEVVRQEEEHVPSTETSVKRKRVDKPCKKSEKGKEKMIEALGREHEEEAPATSKRQKIGRAGTARRSANFDLSESLNRMDIEDGDEEDEEDEVDVLVELLEQNLELPQATLDKIKNYLTPALIKFNMIPPDEYSERTVKLLPGGGSVRITIPPQQCPWVERFHTRSSERGQSANYVIISPFESKLKCWKCSDESMLLTAPEEDLLDTLRDNSSDYLLKTALFRQTHEPVSEFIFHIVKNEHAASLVSGRNGYCHYYYEKKLHRWIESYRLIGTIMKEGGPIQRKFKRFISDFERHNPPAETKSIKKLWSKLQLKLETSGFVRGGLLPLLELKLDHYWSKIAKSRAGADYIENFHTRLDADPKMLGFTNGVWDFHKNVFRDGRPQDFISMSTGIDYVPYKSISRDTTQELETFLSQIFPQKEHLNYVLQEIALSMNGVPAKQRFFIFTGEGANGKSTLMRLLNLAFGRYASEVQVTLFTRPRPAPNVPAPEMIAIKGVRFVSSTEPNAKDPLNLGTIKALSGGDRVTAAAKFQNNQSFYLQATFFMLTNDIPPINAAQNDWGTWRRMKPVSFDSRFVEKPEKPNEVAIDERINDKMENWKGAFASLLIEKYLEGTKHFMPQQYKDLWEQLQNKNDVYGRFTTEVLTKGADLFTENDVLFNVFNTWLDKKGMGKKKVPYDVFEKHMEMLLGQQIKQSLENNLGNNVEKIGWAVQAKELQVMGWY